LRAVLSTDLVIPPVYVTDRAWAAAGKKRRAR
jgi:hypothetical protein